MSRDRWRFLLFVLVLVAAVAVMLSCGPGRVAPEVIPPKPREKLPEPPPVTVEPVAGETQTERALREARAQVSSIATMYAAAQAKVAALQQDVKMEQRERLLGYLRACCLWVSGLALLGLFASAALAVFSPIAKPTLVKVAVACGLVLVLACGCLWALPWLPVVGVVCLVAAAACALVVGVVLVVRWLPRVFHAGEAGWDGYVKAAAIARRIDPEAVSHMDSVSRGTQLVHNAKAEGDRFLALALRHADTSQENLTPNREDGRG